MSRTIKIMDGVKVITSDGIKRLNSPLALWKYMGWDIKKDEMASKCATEITRNLLCFGRVDLSEFAEGTSTFIIEAISPYNYKVQYRAKGERRYKDLDDIERLEEDATEEAARLNETNDQGLEFRVKRIF